MKFSPNVLTAVFAALYALSEALGLTDKIRANSTIELIGDFLMDLLGKK